MTESLFVTEASRNVVENMAYDHMKAKIIIRQAVPGDHQRGLGQVKGKGRWVQDVAQSHMLSYLPMLPFATILIGKKLINDDRGRGEKGLYFGLFKVS